jgi:hypothetical protein
MNNRDWNQPFWTAQREAAQERREAYNDRYAQVAGDPPMKPILAQFPERLNGALMQIKQMPRWWWPQAMYDLIWPVFHWEISSQSEPDSEGLIRLVADSETPEEAMLYLCQYMEKKLTEVRDD